MIQRKSWSERILARIEMIPECGCWLWTGKVNSRGYGVMTETTGNGKRFVFAHRMMLASKLGRPIADGMIAAHHCDVPSCVNPAHIYEGTTQSNIADRVRRGRSRARFSGVTHCVRGHEFTDENTFVSKTGKRGCRVCRKQYSAARYQALKLMRNVR